MFPFGIRMVQDVASLLPGLIGQLIIYWLVGKATLLFSNVPGPKDGLVYGGKKAFAFVVLVPGTGD